MAVGRLEGHLGGFFKGWVYQSQSSSRSPARPPPPHLGWGEYPRDRGRVNTWSRMGGVRMDTRK
jgi:hypothetical protein